MNNTTDAAPVLGRIEKLAASGPVKNYEVDMGEYKALFEHRSEIMEKAVRVMVARVRSGGGCVRARRSKDGVVRLHAYYSRDGVPLEQKWGRARHRPRVSDGQPDLPIADGVSLVNLTRHPVVLYRRGGSKITIPCDGRVATFVREGRSSDVLRTDYGEVPVQYGTTLDGRVEGLPEPVPGVYYIVPAMLRQSQPRRTDLLSPSGLVLDEYKRVIGCREFVANLGEGAQ